MSNANIELNKAVTGKKGGRIAFVVLGLILALVCGVGGIYGTSAWTLLNDTMDLKDFAAELESQVSEGDMVNAGETARSIASLASALKEESSKPQWTYASQLPVLGSDVSAVQALADAADSLCTNALVPLTDAYADLMDAGVVDKDRQVDLIAAALHLNEVRAMVSAVRTAEAEEAIQREALSELAEVHIPQLAEALEKIDGAFDEADKLIDDIEPVLSTIETVTSIAALVGL